MENNQFFFSVEEVSWAPSGPGSDQGFFGGQTLGAPLESGGGAVPWRKKTQGMGRSCRSFTVLWMNLKFAYIYIYIVILYILYIYISSYMHFYMNYSYAFILDVIFY